jgi:predicted ATPase
LRDAFARHHGVELGIEGDAFFVAFVRASDAVAAAEEGQNALGSGPIRVRMGIHSGEPVLTDEGYVGIDVHRAARIAAAGHGGQVLFSRSTYGLLESEIVVRDLGEHRLKDLAEPELIFQLGRDEFPPLKSLSNSNLPSPPSSLVGRQREVEALIDLLTSGRARLVTLTGPGGTGKSRLAIEAGSRLLRHFSDGVFFVELAAIREPDQVISEVARALGVAERGSRGLEEELAGHLESKHLLLVLDNFEQILEAGPAVARLLQASPRLAVVVTSRAPLRLRGEHEFPVPPLGLPGDRIRSRDDVGGAESVHLFVERAAAIAPNFALTDRTAPAVSEICRRLGGLPLAIELAAARVTILDPDELLVRLERQLPLLTGGPRDAPERQRTLRATIEWSYQLLQKEEARLLARLAVFAGTFSLDAGEAVAEADLETMSALVDGSLLNPIGDSRFALLQMVREYASERLEDSDEAERLRDAHAEHFLALAEKAEAELAGPEQTVWLDLLEAEHDNLAAALDWFGGRHPELQLRLIVALRRFWYVRGYLSEARRRLELALEGDAAPPQLRRRALTAAAALALIQGDYEEARTRAEESVEMARAGGESTSLANALSNLGAIVLAAGDSEQARALLEESVGLARQAGDPRVAALAINNLGDVALTTGDYELAQGLFEESLALLRNHGDVANVARSLFNLGAAALRLGTPAVALERWRESIALCRRLGDKEDLAWCLEGFAAVAAEAGEADRAGQLLGAAGTLLEEMGAELKPFERQLHERTVAAITSLLGAEGFAQATTRGAAFTTDQAVDYALADAGNG